MYKNVRNKQSTKEKSEQRKAKKALSCLEYNIEDLRTICVRQFHLPSLEMKINSLLACLF